MRRFAIKTEDNKIVVQEYSSGTPSASSYAEIPDAILPDDYEFVDLEVVPADPDSEFPTEETVIAVVNTERKALVLAQREADRIAREAEEKAKLKERQDLLTKLASSNAQGPLADLIRLVLLNEGVEILDTNPGTRN